MILMSILIYALQCVYTLEDLNGTTLSCFKINQQGLPISRRVNFGFTGSSKPVEEFLLLDK